jgi:hypothetical protein
MTPVDERRGEFRRPGNARGIVVAPGLELACVIADASGGGMRLRLDRNLALPASVLVVDVAGGTAQEVDVAWRKGQEAGVKRRGAPGSLRGLTPSRLTAARDAWLRAGGR